jgi:uncharacterized protein (TIGR04255 family)
MSKLPLKITPCPIIEATVELKFSSSIPKGAIFGLLYSAVRENFNKVEKLPAATLPNEIIENDPNLKYKPLYKLTDGKFTAQVGMDVVSFHSPTDYAGWKDFSTNIVKFFEKINQSGVVEHPVSLTLRYLNFFELDIFQHINFQVQMLNENYQSNNLVIRTETPQGNFIKVLQIANNVTVSNINEQRKGSLIDIACVINKPDNMFSNISTIINDAHKLEKELFFGLLKTDFLNTLKPKY